MASARSPRTLQPSHSARNIIAPGATSYHGLGLRKFSETHNLDIPAVVRRLNMKPAIRIESGMFVAHVDGRDYDVGRIEEGIGRAVNQATQLCREYREGPPSR